MGRTAVHTQEQVFEAADRLAANGLEATPNALRDVLGRGSFTTFVKHIEAWQQVRQSAPVAVVLEMPDSVKAAFAQCWQAAASQAGKEIAAIREKADAEIQSTKRRLDQAIAAIEQMETEAETEAAKLEAVEAALASERAAAQRAATDAATHAAALSATAHQMREQIETHQAEVNQLRKETREMAGQLGRSTGELEALRVQVAGQTEVIKGFAAGTLADRSEKDK